jgi:predicted transcriptional regulator
MPVRKFEDIAREKLGPERYSRIRREVQKELLESSLAEARKLSGKTQTEVAAALEKAQSEISRIEGQDDWLLSTLKRYVEALGGELEVVAVLGDKRLRLRGV